MHVTSASILLGAPINGKSLGLYGTYGVMAAREIVALSVAVRTRLRSPFGIGYDVAHINN